MTSFAASVCLLLLLLATSAVLIFARWRPANRKSTPPATPTSSQQPDERREVELVTLRPHGFEPSEITRPEGPFVLFVEDRGGKTDSSLKLQRLKGDHLRDVNTSRMKSEWHDVIDLPAGEYVLTDASNPEAQCQIRIVP